MYDENRDFESLRLQIVARLSLKEILNNTICDSPLLRVTFYLKNMIPRFKRVRKVINQYLTKAQFLEEHNRLSPLNLRATISLLSRFRIEKASLFKDDNWSIHKLRKPFILWLTSLSLDKKKI
ncbi:hypothetical protein AMJ49_02695 [Parcubacteria bacterium DG_74_2]|nr:MAG: hypothetical protein AMJ49_02695 [Parcubacteria bacterium DG_74_2]